MSIQILYFAALSEHLGKTEESLPCTWKTVGDLMGDLANRGEAWQAALVDNPNVQIAVNHHLARRHTAIQAGDEVAFFPPVTGG